MRDTAYRESRTPCGQALFSILRWYKYDSETVPVVQDSRDAGCQPALQAFPPPRQVLAMAAGAQVDACPILRLTQPTNLVERADALPHDVAVPLGLSM